MSAHHASVMATFICRIDPLRCVADRLLLQFVVCCPFRRVDFAVFVLVDGVEQITKTRAAQFLAGQAAIRILVERVKVKWVRPKGKLPWPKPAHAWPSGRHRRESLREGKQFLAVENAVFISINLIK